MKDDSFSVDVIKRILSVLSNEGNTKRTALAGKTGLNYAALIRYLKFLQTLRWIEFTSDSSLISITAIGRSFRKLLDREEGPEDISEEVIAKLVEQPQASKAEDTGKMSCVFCGKAIKRRAITREVDGKTFSFDRSECATLFMKLRDAYGEEFLL